MSTVGCILGPVLAAGAIRRTSFCEGHVEPKRWPRFAKWARRWKHGAWPRRAGELVQVDHVTCAAGGQTLEEFANRRFARRPPGLEVHGRARLLAGRRRRNAAG